MNTIEMISVELTGQRSIWGALSENMTFVYDMSTETREYQVMSGTT